MMSVISTIKDFYFYLLLLGFYKRYMHGEKLSLLKQEEWFERKNNVACEVYKWKFHEGYGW